MPPTQTRRRWHERKDLPLLPPPRADLRRGPSRGSARPDKPYLARASVREAGLQGQTRASYTGATSERSNIERNAILSGLARPPHLRVAPENRIIQPARRDPATSE